MKRLLLVTMAAMLVGACSGQDKAVNPSPSPTPSFDFTLSVEQNDFGGLAIVATVKNTSTLSVKTRTGVCLEPGLLFTFFDPQGNPIQVSCECGPRPLCPTTSHYSVASGETISDSRWYQGELWESGNSRPAPSGLYTVIVEFEYWMDSGASRDRLTRGVSFLWEQSNPPLQSAPPGDILGN
jgi:hypothetical protein